MMNVCGAVILYQPDNNIIERIKTYRKSLGRLIVIDNSVVDNKQLLTSFLADQNVVYLHDGKNEGIAKRLNQAATLARTAGYTWLLTMDQDSHFLNQVLDQYLSCAHQYENKEKVAMFGVEHDERLYLQSQTCTYTRTTHLITSGSLVNIDILLQINGFDEALFIDHVDHEYCFRAILHGYEILKFTNIFLHHSIGNPSLHRSLYSLKVTTRALHSPIRIYYMVRNFLYIKDKYSLHFGQEISFFRRNLFVRFKNNLLYNKQRTQVLKYIIKGYRDYKSKKMGMITQ